MRAVVCCVAALLAWSKDVRCDETRGEARERSPQFMMLTGADSWSYGGFAHAAALWSPGGLFESGFTLKFLVGGGSYRYRAGVNNTVEVTGRVMLGSVMPGWRFAYRGIEVTAFAGVDIQDHRHAPFDPFSRLSGQHTGVRVAADLWYEPIPASMMVAASASVSSIGSGYWTRAATGWRPWNLAWLGPEALAIGDETYRQYQFGLHATGLRTGRIEWSVGSGWAIDSDDRAGLYGRIGMLLRH